MESVAAHSNDSSIHHCSAAILSEQVFLLSFVLLHFSHFPNLCRPMPLLLGTTALGKTMPTIETDICTRTLHGTILTETITSE